MKILSTISATTAGGRNGQGETSDARVKIDFSGKGGAQTTPEHLFALGYSACFGSALQAVAGIQKKKLPADFSVTVTVPLILGDDGGYSIEADLKVNLPGMERAEAEALAKAAHQVCPYSKATRNNIPVKVSLA
jgi:osmotically inducible protein OsmC